MEDLDCIQLIKDKETGPEVDSAIAELVDRHSGIYIKLSKQYVPASCDFFHSQEDVRREMPTFIWNVAKDYDPSRGCKFSSYLGERARWYFCNSIKKRDDVVNVSSDDLNFWDSYQDPNVDISIENKEILDIIHSKIEEIEDETARKIFKLRYLSGSKNKPMTWRKISKEVGVSHEWCIQLHDRYIREIRESVKKQEKFLTFT